MAALGYAATFTFNLDTKPQIGDVVILKSNDNTRDGTLLRDKIAVVISEQADNSFVLETADSKDSHSGSPVEHWATILVKQSDGIWKLYVNAGDMVVPLDAIYKATYIRNPFAGG